MLTQKRLKNILSYNRKTGLMRWRANRQVVGEGQRPGSYIMVWIDGKLYSVHRLAFLWVTGRWPKAKVDHKDRVRSNNKWSNIRDATHSQNMRNSKNARNNTVGLKGVYFMRAAKKYRAQIRTDYGRLHLGLFQTAIAAHRAYNAAAQKYHGDFARVK